MMRLPPPRGPLSAQVHRLLCGAADEPVVPEPRLNVRPDPNPQPRAVLADPDLQLSLWMLYELSFRGFDDVDDRWERSPEVASLLAAREPVFERALREMTAGWLARARAYEGDVAEQLFALAEEFDEGPDLSRFLRKEATRGQVQEFLRQRSVYHLKESDPHTFVIPRLTGPAKAHLVELQYDEYGAGRPGFLHHELFAATLRAADLDDSYGAYVDEADAPTFAAVNAMSLLCLHRRLRGAAMGHLAAFEATSSIPCRRIAAGLRRTEFGEDAARYFDEHVEADAVHEQLAAREICGAMVSDGDATGDEVLFGAATCLVLDAAQATALMSRWEDTASPDPVVQGAAR